jgi:hypothetical protein
MLTLHAWAGEEYRPVANFTSLDHSVPGDIRRNVVMCPAGKGAVATAGAFRLVDDHRPLVFTHLAAGSACLSHLPKTDRGGGTGCCYLQESPATYWSVPFWGCLRSFQFIITHNRIS